MYDVTASVQTAGRSSKNVPVCVIQAATQLLHSFSVVPVFCSPHSRFRNFKFLSVSRDQVNKSVVGKPQSSVCNCMISPADGAVAVVQSILLPGRAFDYLFVFREFVSEVALIEISNDNNRRICIISPTLHS